MRLLWICLALAVAVAIPFAIWGEGFEGTFTREGTVAWLADYGPWAWAAAILLLTSDLVLPVPATAVVAALGTIYGPVAGALIGAAGSVTSGLLGYGLCRTLGRRGAVRILGERDLVRGERLFARVGGWLVVLSRWLPIFPEVIACMAGLTRMPVTVFVLALVCGSLPLALAFAAIGHLGADRPLLVMGLSALVPPALWLSLQPVLRARARGNARVEDRV